MANARSMIQCDGEIPCSTCVRLKKACMPQQPRNAQDVKFVTFVAAPDSGILRHSDIPSPIQSPPNVHFKDHFITFLINCRFTEQFSVLAPDILPLIESSGPLLDIALAIGALEVSRKSSVRSLSQQNDPGRTALLLYGRSIRAFGSAIAVPGFQPGEEALWTTFFLGLFEVSSTSCQS